MRQDQNSESVTGQGGFRPFQNLDRLIDSASLPTDRRLPNHPHVTSCANTADLSDAELFKAAMADVTPLPAKGRRCLPAARPPQKPPYKCQDDSRQELAALVHLGTGFRVDHTPEYIQGSGAPVDPALFRKLRQGKFAIEAYIDLHGLTADQAALRLDRFISYALKTGKRSVLLVHGRGLSSPGPPVLKALVERLLTQGPHRRWLLAYTSSRQCDGGAGATQVLFRRRPLTGRQVRQARRAGHDPVDLPV